MFGTAVISNPSEEMVEIVVGIGMFGGETRFTMPGSVGNTTSKFWDRGLANVTLCDGPAGLRITKRSVVMKDGSVKPVELPISVFEMFPDFVQKLLKADPDQGTVIYQYTTAFPVTLLKHLIFGLLKVILSSSTAKASVHFVIGQNEEI